MSHLVGCVKFELILGRAPILENYDYCGPVYFFVYCLLNNLSIR